MNILPKVILMSLTRT